MARKKNEPDTIDLFETSPDELDEVIAGLPNDDATLMIYRCRPAGQGHPIFVATYPPSEFSLELIQENHGGGKYNIVAKRGSDVVKKMRVEIEGEPKNYGVVPLAARKPGGFANWFTKQQLEEQEKTAKQSGVDPQILLLMQEIRSLKDSIKESFVNSTGSGFDRGSFLKELMMYKELFVPSNPVGDQTNMISTILQKGLEIGARAANGDVSGSSWVDTIRELIPVAQQALGAFANKQAIEQTARTRINPQATENIQTSINRPLPSNTIGDILPNMNVNQPISGFASIAPSLAPYVPIFIGVASRNGDPNAVVEMIEANLTEDQLQPVVDWLNSPAWFKDLCALDPRIQLQSAWWSELHDILLAELTGVPNNENGKPDTDEVIP